MRTPCRAESDAVLVGAGTVRADDPSLTVRDAPAPRGDPERIVLGDAPPDAKVRPCLEHRGELGDLLDQLGAKGHLQLLVEGGATVAHDFHAQGLVDRYVLYLAPALFGGDDARGLFAGAGAPTIDDVWRGRILSVTRLGDDLRIDLDKGEPLMFTGIVEELGTVVSREGPRLRIAAKTVLDDVELGASIAVNGTCLTVVDWSADEGWWEADVVDESYARTSLGALEPGHPVNLERPVRLSDRLGGHLVQGHVDGVGEIVTAAPDLRVRCDRELLRYVVEKGSITVDGISLTIAAVHDDGFGVAVIPHTMEVTTLGHKGPGDPVNLEVDVTAKYVERLLAWKDA